VRIRLAGTVSVWLLACAALAAADFWEEKNFTTWSNKEVDQMLTDSPWSREVSVHIPDVSLANRVGGLSGGIVGTGIRGRGAGRGGGGVGGAGAGNLGGGSFMAPPRRSRLAVRWASALPVKQASVRRRLSDGAAIPTDLLEPDEPFYQVAVVGIPVDLFQTVGSLGEVRAATSLSRKNTAPIIPIDVRLSYEKDLLVLEFRFPRVVITLDDTEVEFITRLGRTKVSKKFKLEEMIFDGQLTL
jgi:hypothetical protein